MTTDRIRDKYENYMKAVEKLNAIIKAPEVNDYKLDALIQRFEFCYELSWKFIKAWLEYQGVDARTPRDCFREAFAAGLISDGEGWIKMLEDRNLSSHTYNEESAVQIGKRIEEQHYPLLTDLAQAVKGELR